MMAYILTRAVNTQKRLVMALDKAVTAFKAAHPDFEPVIFDPGPKSWKSATNKVCAGWAHGDPLVLSDSIRVSLAVPGDQVKMAQRLVESAGRLEEVAGFKKVAADNSATIVNLQKELNEMSHEALGDEHVDGLITGIEGFIPSFKRNTLGQFSAWDADLWKNAATTRNKWKNGYGDINYRFRDIETGNLAEVQIHNCHVNYEKNQGAGHHLYEQERDITRVHGPPWRLELKEPKTPAETKALDDLAAIYAQARSVYQAALSSKAQCKAFDADTVSKMVHVYGDTQFKRWSDNSFAVTPSLEVIDCSKPPWAAAPNPRFTLVAPHAQMGCVCQDGVQSQCNRPILDNELKDFVTKQQFSPVLKNVEWSAANIQTMQDCLHPIYSIPLPSRTSKWQKVGKVLGTVGMLKKH